jgi:hypothetical protein
MDKLRGSLQTYREGKPKEAFMPSTRRRGAIAFGIAVLLATLFTAAPDAEASPTEASDAVQTSSHCRGRIRVDARYGAELVDSWWVNNPDSCYQAAIALCTNGHIISGFPQTGTGPANRSTASCPAGTTLLHAMAQTFHY